MGESTLLNMKIAQGIPATCTARTVRVTAEYVITAETRMITILNVRPATARETPAARNVKCATGTGTTDSQNLSERNLNAQTQSVLTSSKTLLTIVLPAKGTWMVEYAKIVLDLVQCISRTVIARDVALNNHHPHEENVPMQNVRSSSMKMFHHSVKRVILNVSCAGANAKNVIVPLSPSAKSTLGSSTPKRSPTNNAPAAARAEEWPKME